MMMPIFFTTVTSVEMDLLCMTFRILDHYPRPSKPALPHEDFTKTNNCRDVVAAAGLLWEFNKVGLQILSLFSL